MRMHTFHRCLYVIAALQSEIRTRDSFADRNEARDSESASKRCPWIGMGRSTRRPHAAQECDEQPYKKCGRRFRMEQVASYCWVSCIQRNAPWSPKRTYHQRQTNRFNSGHPHSGRPSGELEPRFYARQVPTHSIVNATRNFSLFIVTIKTETLLLGSRLESRGNRRRCVVFRACFFAAPSLDAIELQQQQQQQQRSINASDARLSLRQLFQTRRSRTRLPHNRKLLFRLKSKVKRVERRCMTRRQRCISPTRSDADATTTSHANANGTSGS
jgi:hypothetical protein